MLGGKDRTTKYSLESCFLTVTEKRCDGMAGMTQPCSPRRSRFTPAQKIAQVMQLQEVLVAAGLEHKRREWHLPLYLLWLESNPLE